MKRFWWCIRYVYHWVRLTHDASYLRSLWGFARSWTDDPLDDWADGWMTPEDAVYEDFHAST